MSSRFRTHDFRIPEALGRRLQKIKTTVEQWNFNQCSQWLTRETPTMRRIIPVSRRNTTGTQRRRSQSKRRQVRSFYFTTGAGKRIESKEDGSLTVMCQVGGNESLETYVHDTLPRTMSPWHVPLSRGLIIYQPITGLSTITHIIILDTTKVLQYPVATPCLFDSKYNRFLIPTDTSAPTKFA